jgi:hypothetical protein
MRRVGDDGLRAEIVDPVEVGEGGGDIVACQKEVDGVWLSGTDGLGEGATDPGGGGGGEEGLVVAETSTVERSETARDDARRYETARDDETVRQSGGVEKEKSEWIGERRNMVTERGGVCGGVEKRIHVADSRGRGDVVRA